MSTKSNGPKRELAAAKRQIHALQRLVVRQNTGALSVVKIALMYGGHLSTCLHDDTQTIACTCQWDDAKRLLSAGDELQAPAVVEAVPEQ